MSWWCYMAVSAAVAFLMQDDGFIPQLIAIACVCLLAVFSSYRQPDRGAGEAQEMITEDELETILEEAYGIVYKNGNENDGRAQIYQFARLIESRARAEERKVILAWIGSEELPFENGDTTELIHRIMDAIRARGES